MVEFRFAKDLIVPNEVFIKYGYGDRPALRRVGPNGELEAKRITPYLLKTTDFKGTISLKRLDSSDSGLIEYVTIAQYVNKTKSNWDSFCQDFVSGVKIGTGIILMGSGVAVEGYVSRGGVVPAAVAFPFTYWLFTTGWNLTAEGLYEATEGEVNIWRFPALPLPW